MVRKLRRPPTAGKVSDLWFDNEMARPRKVSDDALLAAAASAIGRHGPRFTLAQVAEEAGVATATAAARFGSKHQLLRWMASVATDQLRAEIAAAAAGASDAVQAVREAAAAGLDGIDDPATTANHLAQLGADLADPELRTDVARMWAVHRRELERLLTVADLPGAPPPAEAARLLAALVHGTQVHWAVVPEGSLRERLVHEVDAVLRAWEGAPVREDPPRLLRR
jgi:AcrR family transcriptional regulator